MRKIRSKLEVLSEEEVLRINDAALKILDEVGIHVPNDELLGICRERSCVVDTARQILRFPRKVMETFIDEMRTKSLYKVSDEAQKLGGSISTQVSLVDYETGSRRYGLRDDNLKAIKLVEQLKNIPCANAAVVPSDVPYEIADVITIADIHKYSTKPGGTYILTPTGAKYVARINKLLGLRGGYLFECISPLTFKADSIEMALAFAKAGGGLGIAPMAMGSTTAPITVAGTLTLETAEVLGSIFLVHAMTGEYPGFAASCHTSDLRTMICSFGSPNQALFAVASGQLARFYGIQGGANTGLTDALSPDFQGGFEKGVTAAFNSLSGLWSIGCQGIVGADQGFSFEQLVIDNEWIDYYNYILDGFEVNDDTIGFDMIKAVGPAGNFLGEAHTVEHIKDSYWNSAIFGREDWPNWIAGGSKTIYRRAHEFVEQAVAGYKTMTPVQSSEICSGLDNICSEAWAEMRSLSKV
ncbi:MAG: trimethylamine methyltransferase family protein [Treponema sp.]|jgi:trimethylamine--corrinoid protein Co-methyltransferase|nr:trimethylamine methyltransferase family protein [Treponema sp.]